ncbi:MAG: LysM peptidoglycan-binding domain-containing protein [Candidatus Riflebacteria bacterium]|nr:LysM peptidoglycan-binding domain-containing protein [Candidatus Riflebacteria bacterium]
MKITRLIIFMVALGLFCGVRTSSGVEMDTTLANHDPGIAPASAASSPPAPSATPASSSGSNVYTVRTGDTLAEIAKRFLGDSSKYTEIVEANKNKYSSLAKNPNLIYPGWELTIPGVNNIPSAADMPIPTVGAPAAGAKGERALLGWLQQAGLSGENLRTAWAIGMAESAGNPSAHNGNSRTGDNSYGLFQINMLGSMGPSRLKQYGLSSNNDLFDPMTNIRVMIKMSNNCTKWSDWSTYKTGAYKKFVNQFPPK